MRLTACVVMLLLICVIAAQSQSTKSVPLRPIFKQGWKYFYGDKKVNNVYALQIPLQELNNKEINERFRKFKTYRLVGALCYLPSLVFLLTNNHLNSGHYGRRGRTDVTNYALLVVGGTVGNFAFNALGHHQMDKAIDIYNIQIAERSSLGVSLNRLPNANWAGLSYSLRF